MSCLFQSLSHFINYLDENALRNIICDYLQSNPTIFDTISANQMIGWRDDMELSKYIIEMRNNNTWGSSLEIKAFCNIFNIVVIVHYLGKEIEFIPIMPNPRFLIRINYTGNHYEPMSANLLTT